MPTRLTPLIVALAAFALGGVSLAGMWIDDDSKIEDPKLRAKIARATESLRKPGSDLAALEVLLGFFGEAVVDTVCGNVSYSFSDPTKKEAYAAILDSYSLDFLDMTLRQGSDLARYWALRKLWHQDANSRPEPGDNYKRLAARGGVVDDAAKAKIREAVLKVAKEATPRTRGFAIFVVTRVPLVENRKAFLKDNLNDGSAAVVAAAISGLADMRAGDPELDDTVWGELENAKGEELVVACLGYLWLDDRTSLDERKQLLLEGLLDNPRVGKYRQRSRGWRFDNPRDRVLKALARALSERATPENPRMIALLLRLAQDKDEWVRHDAIRSLRNARTPEVQERLVEFFGNKEPQCVRSAALEILGIFKRRDVVLAAAKDESVNIRCKAMYWLRQLRAYDALEAALDDPSEPVRERAARELKWLGQ